MKMQWTQQEIEADHDYTGPHVEMGIKLHGGFDESGKYISPRTKYRTIAVDGWRKQLSDRGVDLVEANISLLKEESYPNPQQQKLLLRYGLGQTLFNSLTNIGRTEARGAMIASIPVPDFQSIIVEDIGGTCLAHLDKGLFSSHGWDEGGNPDSDQGAHDQMWFTARDLLWQVGTYEMPAEVAGGPAGGEAERSMPLISPHHERVIAFMMMVLMIEIKAYRGFAFNEDVMRDPQLFTDRRAQADSAADIVARIRQDEDVHVAYLQTALSEFRSFTVRTPQGQEVPASEVFDQPWEDLRYRSGVLQPRQMRKEMEVVMQQRILTEPSGEQIFEQYKELETPLPPRRQY